MKIKERKTILIIFLLLTIIISIIGKVYFDKWLEVKMKKIEFGLAEPTFPFRDYTQEELNKMYPQIKNADVPTRTTPEETYAKFRQALKENNLQMAIEQLSRESERYGENVKLLEDAYKDGKFFEIYKEYPENIKKAYIYESIAQFYFIEENENGKKTIYPITFIKDSNGDWKIDNL